jgi:glutamate-ammonia-ligase adenylyltransferase
LLLLEYGGLINTEEAMRSWSDCADAMILHSLKFCQKVITGRYGTPRDEYGAETYLYTLAMGKLGGLELNYSSDIDLIFAFSKAGATDGSEPISNQQYFSKVIQLFIQVIQNITPQGFVFRVDLRLRPNGDSGALVFSIAAMDTYYQEQGRDWERYAMVKARVINESLETNEPWFEQLITPFVYRRYVDFSVIESLRSMKAMIEKEVQINPRLDDMKRGQGGIREVEFIIQSFQLIRGGRLPQLREQNALAALLALKKERMLSRCTVLKQAYLYLRRLENAVQSLNDQQTHSLPEDDVKKTQVTLAMGYSSWDELIHKFHQYQRIISHSFRSILGAADDYKDEQRLLGYQLNSLWHGHVESSMAINLLAGLDYANAEQCYQMLHTFRHGSRCRRLSQAARLRLDRFMVLLLTELAHCVKTDVVLSQVIHLLENIVGRSAYLALLTENPQVLKELIYCFSHSPFITSLLVTHPFLLEVLLDQQHDWQPSSRAQLEQKISDQLRLVSEIEMKEDLLRQFKLTHWLMAARAELYGVNTAVRIGQFLADVAEVIVKHVFNLASDQLSERYSEIKEIKSRFAIIAYGKLGSREMNYSSDLDLVFLYSANSSEEALVTRLTQKIVHMLTTRSQVGVLFTVDTRLRPSGSAGLLVSHLDAFIEYQKKQAWTWEHQALLKARVIVGIPRIKQHFLGLKKTVFALQRDPLTLRQDVLEMRARIDVHQQQDVLKHTPGGLLDLEFLIQYLVLRFASPHLARFTHTLSQIKQLYNAKVLTKEEYMILKSAYNKYHYSLHQHMLSDDFMINLAVNEKVNTLCQKFYR